MVSILPLTLPFTFGGVAPPTTTPVGYTVPDLNIYYDGDSYITCKCSRFDVQDYNVIMETWLNKAQLKLINDNIRPGAVKELKRVIFSPKFYDATWQGNNTLRLKPVQGTSLYRMRGSEKIIYPKNISSTPLPGDSGWINCKVEGAISGASL